MVCELPRFSVLIPALSIVPLFVSSFNVNRQLARLSRCGRTAGRQAKGRGVKYFRALSFGRLVLVFPNPIVLRQFTYPDIAH